MFSRLQSYIVMKLEQYNYTQHIIMCIRELREREGGGGES